VAGRREEVIRSVELYKDGRERVMSKRTGTPHDIRITMEGGVIQAVDNVPEGVRVVVMDFDVEDYDVSELKTNGRGERYLEVVFDSQGESKCSTT
jgi:hypothetical protein